MPTKFDQFADFLDNVTLRMQENCEQMFDDRALHQSGNFYMFIDGGFIPGMAAGSATILRSTHLFSSWLVGCIWLSTSGAAASMLRVSHWLNGWQGFARVWQCCHSCCSCGFHLGPTAQSNYGQRASALILSQERRT